MKRIILTSLSILSFTQTNYAAQLLQLSEKPTNIIRSFMPLLTANMHEQVTLKELNRYTDANKITHIRVQEYYGEYPVVNAQAVLHVPAARTLHVKLNSIVQKISDQDSMNGKLFKNLGSDLNKIQLTGITNPDARAIKFATKHFTSLHPEMHLTTGNAEAKKVIWMDESHQAHWAYQVTFDAKPDADNKIPARPTYIINADNLKIYKQWDNIQTIGQSEYVNGGGWGGNHGKGRLMYDGLPGHLPFFTVKRENNSCFFDNDDTVVQDAKTAQTMQYLCLEKNKSHNNVYWSANFDNINGGFSPANDAMFSAQVIKQFYRDWYQVPALINPNGSEMKLIMKVHQTKLDNAYWNGVCMTFGDGEQLYPLTSLDIAVHEVSHGFTQQHSNLMYEGQSGGMNESFSDMAAKAAEFYVYHKNDWRLAADVLKFKGESLRYMDHPSKDCFGKSPGSFCSIEYADDYYDGLDVHFSSGVYNRLFYLLSTTQDWDPRKAFAVMLQANAAYWVNTTQYADGAACVVRAAEDLHYDTTAVKNALKAVGIVNLTSCTNND